MNDCLLCKKEVKTKFYYEDDNIWIVECETCKCPLIVYKKHQEKFPPIQMSLALKRCKKLFGDRYTYVPDMKMRSIRDHAHFHLRMFYNNGR